MGDIHLYPSGLAVRLKLIIYYSAWSFPFILRRIYMSVSFLERNAFKSKHLKHF